MQHSLFRAKLEQALLRRSLLLESGEPVRIFDSAGDGLPGISVDKFAGLLLIHLDEQEFERLESLEEIKRSLVELTECQTLYLRIHASSARESAARPVQLLYGNDVERLWIEEQGIKYLVKPAQVNAGFFIDARGLRQLLRENSAGKRVLNTFAFSGALGLSALAGGATEVVQVDISKSVLGWAKENYEHNKEHLSSDNMRFIAEDCRTFMSRELRRIEKGKPAYDTVIIDAPAYGSSNGKPFRLLSEYQTLARTGIELLNPGGSLVFTCNSRQLFANQLARTCKEQARVLGRSVASCQEVRAPLDFPGKQDQASHIRGAILQLA